MKMGGVFPCPLHRHVRTTLETVEPGKVKSTCPICGTVGIFDVETE